MALDIIGPRELRLSDDRCDQTVLNMAMSIPNTPVLQSVNKNFYGTTQITVKQLPGLLSELHALRQHYINSVGEPLARRNRIVTKNQAERNSAIEKLLHEDPCFVYINRFIEICNDAIMKKQGIRIEGD